MKNKNTDQERLDFLQRLTNIELYTGRVVCRMSSKDRGWRLHETSAADSFVNVREAIDRMMEDPNIVSLLDEREKCWICGKKNPNVTIIVERDRPEGDECQPKIVKVHYGCYLVYNRGPGIDMEP